MKLASLVFVLTCVFITLSYAAIYKWVDENGTTHFSDKPSSSIAEKVEIKETGISVQKPGGVLQSNTEFAPPENKAITEPARSANHKKFKAEEKILTEDDYQINASVGKLGADIIRISGRIGRGPACKDMIVTATAENENGLSASVNQKISKSNSYGSTIFEGVTKVAGSSDDSSFWEIRNVTVRCSD
jgi:hypothetical protein